MLFDDPDMEFKPRGSTTNTGRKSKAVELQRMLKYKLKFDVVEELIDLYQNNKTTNSDKRQILTDLMRYLYPQLKAMEIDTKQGEQIKVNIVFPGAEIKQDNTEDEPTVVEEIIEVVTGQ
jgi:hypothetical protein